MAKSTININISGGGTDTSDATAIASDITSGKTAYVATGKVTGTAVVANGLMIVESNTIYGTAVLLSNVTQATNAVSA